MSIKIQSLQSNKLALENEGVLSLFPIGAGSAFTKAFYQNNYMIIKGKDHIQVDCGTRTPEAFQKLGLSITEIQNYLITHSHADHIGGLEEVILLGRYATRKKPKIIITKEYQKFLWNYSLKGGAGFGERIRGRYLGFEDFWDIIRPKKIKGFKRNTWEIQFGSINIKMFRTKHYPDSARSWKDSTWSTGLVIDDRVLFTGDTRFDPELLEDFTSKLNIESIFHDVQFFPGGVHAPFEDLKTLPSKIKEKMFLMHYPDNYEEREEEVKEFGFLGFTKQQCYHNFL